MKIDVLQITDAEMEIMKLIWRTNKPLTAEDIGKGLPDRHWSLSTIHTLAMRLESRGILKYYKLGRKNHYLPYISEFEYKFMALKSAQNLLCGGSLADMLEILLCDAEITAAELERVKEMVGEADVKSECVNPDTPCTVVLLDWRVGKEFVFYDNQRDCEEIFCDSA